MPYTPLAKTVLVEAHCRRHLADTKQELVRTNRRLQQAYREIEELLRELVRTRMLLDSLRMIN